MCVEPRAQRRVRRGHSLSARAHTRLRVALRPFAQASAAGDREPAPPGVARATEQPWAATKDVAAPHASTCNVAADARAPCAVWRPALQRIPRCCSARLPIARAERTFSRALPSLITRLTRACPRPATASAPDGCLPCKQCPRRQRSCGRQASAPARRNSARVRFCSRMWRKTLHRPCSAPRRQCNVPPGLPSGQRHLARHRKARTRVSHSSLLLTATPPGETSCVYVRARTFEW